MLQCCNVAMLHQHCKQYCKQHCMQHCIQHCKQLQGKKPFLSKNEELRYLQNISMISTYHLLFMYFLLLFKSKCLQPLVHYYQTPCIIMLARNLILLVTPANGHRPAAPVLQISHICANCTLYNTALSNCTNKGKLLYK